MLQNKTNIPYENKSSCELSACEFVPNVKLEETCAYLSLFEKVFGAVISSPTFFTKRTYVDFDKRYGQHDAEI